MCDNSRYGIAATVVVAEHLTEKAPDCCDWIEHSIPKLDAMFIENIQDVFFG